MYILRVCSSVQAWDDQSEYEYEVEVEAGRWSSSELFTVKACGLPYLHVSKVASEEEQDDHHGAVGCL